MRTQGIVLFLTSSLFLTGVAGQTSRKPTSQQPKTKSERKLVETVKTEDGRQIRLYDDMSYEVAASTMPASPAMINLNIKAGVITKGGDVKAVARRDFIIFKEDIKSVLSTVSDREGKPLEVFSFYLADQFRELDEGRVYNGALEKLKPITVGTVTTDFEGNASLQIPSSNTPYWIYGSTQRVGRSSCMWYLQITTSKSASIVLDNNNATYCG